MVVDVTYLYILLLTVLLPVYISRCIYYLRTFTTFMFTFSLFILQLLYICRPNICFIQLLHFFMYSIHVMSNVLPARFSFYKYLMSVAGGSLRSVIFIADNCLSVIVVTNMTINNLNT